METPRSIRRKPVTPFHSPPDQHPDVIGLDGLNFGSGQDEATTDNKSLLDDSEVQINGRVSENHTSWIHTTLGWGWELLASATSMLALCAIVGILLAFNHKSLSDWPYRIKLNTLVSVFAQISSTALAIPLSECISQLKWLWFTRNHPLSDFDSFDKASRGPWSSLLLLWKTRARHLVSFGAVLVVANLAFQSFAQQTVSFPLRNITNGTAELRTIHNLTSDGLQGGPSPGQSLWIGGYLPPSTVASIYAGLGGGVNLSQVVPSCPAGNCTWDTYDSLALCANPVANLTHLLNRATMPENADCNCSTLGTMSDHICNYSLPSGAYLAGEDMFTNITSLPLNGSALQPSLSAYANLKSIAFSNIPVVLDFFMVYYSASINNVAAIEASLSFCGQSYNTSVTNGKTNTMELGRWGSLNTSAVSDWYPMWPIVGNSTTLWVHEGFVTSLQYTLATTLTGYREVNDDGLQTFSTVAVQALNNTLVGSQDDVATLQSFVDELAVSISNNLRTGPGNIMVDGVNKSVETYISVDWFWLIFPFFVAVFTFAFLLATIVKNSGRRAKLWKSSSLAVLSGLNRDTKVRVGDLTEMTMMRERAKGVHVRLVEDHGQWQLVGE